VNSCKLSWGIALALFATHAAIAAPDTAPPDPNFHQIYGVASWLDVVPEKAAEYKTYRLIILGDTKYTPDEKSAMIAKKYAEIREAVRAIRIASYQEVTELIGVSNSATKGGSGGSPVKVDAKCAGAGKPNMYTTADWVRGAYRSGSANPDAKIFEDGRNRVDPKGIVIENGDRVCAIALKQSGAGRKYSYSEGKFRIRPAEITKMVAGELPAIMYAISNTPI